MQVMVHCLFQLQYWHRICLSLPLNGESLKLFLVIFLSLQKGVAQPGRGWASLLFPIFLIKYGMKDWDGRPLDFIPGWRFSGYRNPALHPGLKKGFYLRKAEVSLKTQITSAQIAIWMRLGCG
jgi:hypothetical protein